MVATAVPLSDLESHSPVAGLFKCNPSNIFVQHITRYRLTVCSHGSSALAERLVGISVVDSTKNEVWGTYQKKLPTFNVEIG